MLFGGIWFGVFPSRPQCAILGTGILGQIASFERRLRGAAQTSLALPHPLRTWPRSGTCRLSETSEKCAIFCILGGIRPSYSWILAYICRAWTKKHTWHQVWENIYFQAGIISKLASYFVPTTLFSWSHLEALGLLCTSYDWVLCRSFSISDFKVKTLSTFVRAFVVFEGGRSLPLHPVPVLVLHPREIQLVILWSKTVGQSRPNNRNYSRYKGSETLAAFRVRKHNKTGQTIKQTESKHERSRF